MKNYDHNKSFYQNLKREIKQDWTKESFVEFVCKEHRLLVESFFMGILLILYFQYIWPMIEMIPSQEDPKIALAIGGFIFFSLLSFMILIPYWITSWLFIIVESLYVFGLKVNRRLRNES